MDRSTPYGIFIIALMVLITPSYILADGIDDGTSVRVDLTQGTIFPFETSQLDSPEVLNDSIPTSASGELQSEDELLAEREKELLGQIESLSPLPTEGGLGLEEAHSEPMAKPDFDTFAQESSDDRFGSISPTDDYAHQGIPERMLAVEDGLEVVKAQLSENTSVIKEMSERIDLISQQLEISSPFGLKLSVDDSAEQERARIAMYKPPSREPNYVGENEIAVVAVESAGGYTGFHDYDNEILSFPRGTRLIVEDRQGEWYRVRATSGARAWVRANEVLFGSGKRGEIIGTVRVHGVDPMVR